MTRHTGGDPDQCPACRQLPTALVPAILCPGPPLCETCRGHGSLVGEAIPYEELSPRRKQGADNGMVYRRCKPCPDCDGEDHATPLAEAQADL